MSYRDYQACCSIVGLNRRMYSEYHDMECILEWFAQTGLYSYENAEDLYMRSFDESDYQRFREIAAELYEKYGWNNNVTDVR